MGCKARVGTAICIMCLCVFSTGCMGWGDILAEKRQVAGAYVLMKDEDKRVDNVLLFWGSSVIADPIRKMGWNQEYILYTDDRSRGSWNVIKIREGKAAFVSEAQRMQNANLRSIAILSPTQAWVKAKH